MEEQYSANTVAQVAALEQALMHQDTASALRTLASQRDTKKGSQQASNRPLDPSRVAPVGVAPEGVSLMPGRLSPSRLRLLNPRVFSREGGRQRSLDLWEQDFFISHQHGRGARTILF